MDNIRKEIGYAEGFSDGQYANSERIRELEAENKALREGRGAPVAYRYRYMNPISGNPVWRMSGGEWNNQQPRETHPLYASPAPVSVGEAVRVILADDDALTDLAIQTMRNNNPAGDVSPGYIPALTAALRAIAERED